MSGNIKKSIYFLLPKIITSRVSLQLPYDLYVSHSESLSANIVSPLQKIKNAL